MLRAKEINILCKQSKFIGYTHLPQIHQGSYRGNYNASSLLLPQNVPALLSHLAAWIHRKQRLPIIRIIRSIENQVLLEYLNCTKWKTHASNNKIADRV
jgi:hypothetical protein